MKPRNQEEQKYYDDRYKHYLSYYEHPAVQMLNMSPRAASEKRAQEDLDYLQAMNDTRATIKCCARMQEEIADGSVVSIHLVKYGEGFHPYVHIISDGGHGGSAEISYCPFCGTKINLPKQEI